MKYLIVLCLALGACTKRHYYLDCNESDINILDLKKPIRTSCYKIDEPPVKLSPAMRQLHRDVGISVKNVRVVR